MFVKPKDGVKVVIPGTRPHRMLDPAGETVPDDPYWHRRVRDGDAVIATPPAEAAAPPAAETMNAG